MKIQLIHPPVYINENGLTALRPSLPLGLAYIAAVLRDDGHQVSVVDALGLAPNTMTPEGDIWRLGLPARRPVDPQAAATSWSVCNRRWTGVAHPKLHL